MGIIIVDLIIVIHLVFSVLQISKRNLVGCQLVGLIGVFGTFAGAAYHFYLSELILSVSKVFNPKDLSHLKYHFYAIITGLGFSLVSIIIEDIGITCFGNCGTARGSILEFLYMTIIVFVWPYCIFSAVKCIIKIKKDKSVLQDQKQLYLCHIANIIIFSVCWMPMITLHFLDYSLKLNLQEYPLLRNFSLTIVATTPFLHSVSRVYFDSQLKDRFTCKRKRQVQDHKEGMEKLLDNSSSANSNDASKMSMNANRQSVRPVYERLTQTETLNNLLSTFSGICLLMDDVYDLYFQNQFTSETVDNLSQNNLASEEIVRKKITKIYSVDSVQRRYNSENEYSFPEDLEKNFQKDLRFEITEYACLIFQNLRSLHSMKQEMFRESLIPFKNTKTLLKSFEKTSAKGGKPLIKTHDKKFLIKEVKKEEKDFFMSILPKYHQHLKKNPKSLMAKIVGIYSIRIGNKDKVYQILMESLDPIDEKFIKFKYDLKFSSVNRREFKRKEEVKVVQAELLEQDPTIEEIFPAKKALSSLKDIDKGLGIKLFPSSNGSDSKSKDQNIMKKKRKKSKTSGSGSTGNDTKSKSQSNGKSKTTISGDQNTDYDDEDDSEERDLMNEDDYDDDDIENDEKFKQMDYEEQLVYREQKQLYRQQRQWSNEQKINFKDNPQLKQQLMNKLGLLKDSDFKCMHDRKLPVHVEYSETIGEFLQTIEKDVRFLEGLRIMDYSLFLIILQLPKQEENSVYQKNNGDDTANFNIGVQQLQQFDQSSFSIFNPNNDVKLNKEKEVQITIDELIRHNRFVMFSPSKRFVYLMGLIDYLGRWNLNKKSELIGKTFLAHFVRQNTDFSVKPPHEFARRFLRKVKKIFKVQTQKDSKRNADIFAQSLGNLRMEEKKTFKLRSREESLSEFIQQQQNLSGTLNQDDKREEEKEEIFKQ